MTDYIQAFDTEDDTFYVLWRPNKEPVCAPWPAMLEALSPNAVRLASYGDVPYTGFAVHPGQRKAKGNV